MTLADAPEELDAELELEDDVPVALLSSDEVEVAVLVDEAVVVEFLEPPERPDAPAAPVAAEPAPVATPLAATVASVFG